MSRSSSCIIKSTIVDLLKNRSLYYAFGFGFVFLFLISVFNIPFSIEFTSAGGGPATDLSKYPNLVLLHLFISFWLMVCAILAQNNIVGEIEDGAIQIIFLSVKKEIYFISKLFALLVVLMSAILGNILLVGLFVNKMFLYKVLFGLCIIPNILLLLSFVLFFVVLNSKRNAALMGLLSYAFFAILNIEMVLHRFFFEKLAITLNYILPSVTKWQIIAVNIAYNMDITKHWYYWIINLLIYITIIATVCICKSRQYEV